ncbi:MAG: hypothetical protein U9R79_12645 [Armatimonadota bacterium]|nr:hypothetical protein [Armatimonadota bacterium]
MFSRDTVLGSGMICTLAAVVAFTFIFGGVIAPRPAAADNDLERALAGIAAGALVYGMIGDDDPSHVGARHRGFYNGNRGDWDHRERPRQRQRPQPRYHYKTREYNRGYDHGWHNGYDYGHRQGYRRGYDHGFGDGYDYGRRRDWGGWGWSGWGSW